MVIYRIMLCTVRSLSWNQARFSLSLSHVVYTQKHAIFHFCNSEQNSEYAILQSSKSGQGLGQDLGLFASELASKEHRRESCKSAYLELISRLSRWHGVAQKWINLYNDQILRRTGSEFNAGHFQLKFLTKTCELVGGNKCLDLTSYHLAALSVHVSQNIKSSTFKLEWLWVSTWSSIGACHLV